MEKFDKYLINHIFSFVFSSQQCITNILRKAEYANCLLISKQMYHELKKECSTFNIYKSRRLALPLLCECGVHIKDNNKNYIIDLLNWLKRENSIPLQSKEFTSKHHAELIIPYLIDLDIQHFRSKEEPTIMFLMSKYERLNTFL